MRIRIDEFLTAGQISDATKDKPVLAVIKNVELRLAEDLPFEGRKDRYELTLQLEEDDEKWNWLANKTSLRALMDEFGSDAEDWSGRSIKLWVSEMLVQGKMKKVIFSEPV